MTILTKGPGGVVSTLLSRRRSLARCTQSMPVLGPAYHFYVQVESLIYFLVQCFLPSFPFICTNYTNIYLLGIQLYEMMPFWIPWLSLYIFRSIRDGHASAEILVSACCRNRRDIFFLSAASIYAGEDWTVAVAARTMQENAECQWMKNGIFEHKGLGGASLGGEECEKRCQ